MVASLSGGDRMAFSGYNNQRRDRTEKGGGELEHEEGKEKHKHQERETRTNRKTQEKQRRANREKKTGRNEPGKAQGDRGRK